MSIEMNTLSRACGPGRLAQPSARQRERDLESHVVSPEGPMLHQVVALSRRLETGASIRSAAERMFERPDSPGRKLPAWPRSCRIFDYGVRLLFRHRDFTVVAALVLAFGIGANTAVFTMINSLVLKPRPGAPDNELAGVYSRDRTTGRRLPVLLLSELQRSARSASCSPRSPRTTSRCSASTEGTGTSRIFADVITANYFDTFGVAIAARPRVHDGRRAAGREHPGHDRSATACGSGSAARIRWSAPP